MSRRGTADLHARRWYILGVLVLSLLVVVIDTTVMNVALKTIADPTAGLGASQSDLEWMLNSYTLVFAGLLITFGMLGDRYGHRKVLLTGMIVFGAASGLSAYSTSPGELIAWRAVMGLGGAAILPATLAIISHVFPPRERAKAIGIWAGAVGLAVAIGPVVGGALINHFWWGSAFMINVPIVIVGVVAMFFIVPATSNPKPPRLDPVGVLLSVIGLVGLVYGIIEGGDNGDWLAMKSLGAIIAGVAVLSLFVLWEFKSKNPAIDMRLFRNARFSTAVVAVALVFFAQMGLMFFFSFYLQNVRGNSPLVAGAWMTPFALAQLIFAPLSARMVRRFGAKAVCGFGLGVATLAFVPYLFVNTGTPMWVIGLVFFVQGMAMANVIPPATESVMASLPREKAGAGSAVNNTGRQVGGALGVAIVGSILSSAYRDKISPVVDRIHGLTAAQRGEISGSIGSTDGFVEQNRAAHPGVVSLIEPANNAFIHAMHVAVIGSMAVAALGFLSVLIWLPRRGAAQPTVVSGQAEAQVDSPAENVAEPVGS
jgi:EmrB/QacA subfamily drug resistance transporter